MSFGLDYVSGPPIADLKAAGVTFVCRYLSEVNNLTAVKLLTKAEADTLRAAGISIVSNFEWYSERPLEGEAAGIADAQIAQSQHEAAGGPPDRPIYFSVDFDVTPAQAPAVAAYFKGIASVIGLRRAAAYGPIFIIKYLFDNNLISWGWQTYAWSGGQWDARAHIQQYENGVILSGKSVDYDRAMTADFGQWGGPMNTVPQNWHDDGTTLTAPNGHKVVKGFRQYILSNSWDPADYPLMEEFHTNSLEDSNSSLGPGQQQIFRMSMLGWTQAHGVFREWLGVELAYTRNQVAQYYQQVDALQKQIADLEAKLQQAGGQALADIQAIKTAVAPIGAILAKY